MIGGDRWGLAGAAGDWWEDAGDWWGPLGGRLGPLGAGWGRWSCRQLPGALREAKPAPRVGRLKQRGPEGGSPGVGAVGTSAHQRPGP